MPRHTDTIAALATPVGTSALAVIRVSGPDTERIMSALWGGPPLPREMRRGDYRDIGGKILDDVLYVFFRAPHSYTGEDSLEISCHGNPFISQRIVEDLLVRGACTPEPGEFTKRAFLNGRMDLSQAEAVMDLIHARSERAIEAANRQLRGSLSRRMEELIRLLTAVVAEIEAYIDFPEEDLPAEDFARIERGLDSVIRETSDLRATGKYGDLLRNGIKTVIVGAPNVGKSSLLNRLVGHDRALVSEEPGTTRDYIEESIVIGNYCFRLIDTAGLNTSPQPLERLGMSKAMARLSDSDLIVIVADVSNIDAPIPAELRDVGRGNVIRVVSKIDLAPPSFHIPPGWIGVSALTGIGVDLLRATLAGKIDGLCESLDEESVAINARHSHALDQALEALNSVNSQLANNESAELIASNLRSAIAAFEEIAGKVDNEVILDELFRRFCIGK
ncbi:MAG TPA: tRNA uridine-5-carboxymethylaminomethyl(34) synthesis GTPase MnmE [Opitutus sp.]|nr:tRNA uridine-5-carboxymethylaminomethyl(34) synthesis GTPase MnmE [Opitutus sp.]